jgi:acyl-CoA synthetase (AMP-forming)/AMP-acid ligase II
MIEHRQIHNYAEAIRSLLGCTPGDRFLALTTFAADLVYTMLFGSLTSGGCLHIVERIHAIDAGWLDRYIIRCGIDFAKTVPSHLMALTSAGRALSSLKQLVLGGEEITSALLARIEDWPFINHYGPAETAVGVLAQRPGTLPPGRPRTALGRALPHAYWYIEAPRQQLVPDGVVGELMVGGYSVGRGYVSRSRDTADRFRPDRWSARDGARVYKTGDLACIAGDGELYFKGRRDTQLKIRGHRVELGDVAQVLSQHPAVEHAWVCARVDEETGSASLHAYAVIASTYLAAVKEDQYDLWRRNWQKVFEAAYADDSVVGESGYASASWKSSYTGEAMREHEIREQMDGICARVLAWKPRTVLELGCGTGSLLLHLAPHCDAYVATDFSAHILQQTQRLVERSGLSSRVRLVECDAHDLAAVGEMKFDVVVLNSVVQYFPDTEYLERVLRGAEQRLAQGGRILVGDVRDVQLLKSLHASVALFRALPAEGTKKLARRVARRVELDSELCLEPSYFVDLARRLERTRHAEIHLKRGMSRNELVRFRFDVVLQAESALRAVGDCRRQPWDEESDSLVALEERLAAGESPLLLEAIPNARLIAPVWLSRQLDHAGPFSTCEDITRALEPLPGGIEPEELYQLAQRRAYDVRMQRSGASIDRFDALFVKRSETAAPERADTTGPLCAAARARAPDATSRAEPVSSPLLKQLSQSVGPELVETCRRQLPEYMVPSRIALVTRLPVNLNGKLDASQLPTLGSSRLTRDEQYVEPEGPIERVVAAAWEEILAVDRVGAEDDFFGLGGHSLLATEVVARLEAIFQTQVPLSSLFGSTPTVRGIARIIVENEREKDQARRIAEIWHQIQAMTEEEVEARLRAPSEAGPTRPPSEGELAS